MRRRFAAHVNGGSLSLFESGLSHMTHPAIKHFESFYPPIGRAIVAWAVVEKHATERYHPATGLLMESGLFIFLRNGLRWSSVVLGDLDCTDRDAPHRQTD
jgi:hypothetical protein